MSEPVHDITRIDYDLRATLVRKQQGVVQINGDTYFTCWARLNVLLDRRLELSATQVAA